MSLYFKLKTFQAVSPRKYNSQTIYYLLILVDNQQRRRYKLYGQLIDHFILDDGEPYISVAGEESEIEVAMVGEDSLGNFKILTKQVILKSQLIRQRQLQRKPIAILSIYLSQFLEQSIKQSRQNVMRKQQLQEEQKPYRLRFQVKYDAYQKIYGRMNRKMRFTREVKQFEREQKKSTIEIPRIGKVRIQKVNQENQENNNKKEEQANGKKIPSVEPLRKHQRTVTDFYVGPCRTKNIFSCMDKKFSDQDFTIYEHEYETTAE